MTCQMIRVISSPSISTTGFATLIFDMPCFSLHNASTVAWGRDRPWSLGGQHQSGDKHADTEGPQPREVSQPAPRYEHARAALGQRQPDQGGGEKDPSY